MTHEPKTRLEQIARQEGADPGIARTVADAQTAPLRLTTRDVALAIAAHLEDRPIYGNTELENGDLEESDAAAEIDFVDASDPHNPVIFLDNGQTFTLRIIAGDPPADAPRGFDREEQPKF